MVFQDRTYTRSEYEANVECQQHPRWCGSDR
jgi:hypothetical protein